jgi:glycosyltransferase involved in cell wall biosynthesis
MKVIFITREGQRLPGARIRCYNFARELRKYGLETEVLSFSDSLGAKDGERESEMSLKEKIRYNWNAFNRLRKQKKAILYIQRFNYHSFAPYLVHLLQGNKIILDLDDWEMREEPKYYLNIYPSSKAHYITSHIARRSIFCVAASRFLEEFLLQFNKKVYYIPSGVDAGLFKTYPDNLAKERVVFSWVGTLHKKEYIENIDFALSCFNLLRKTYPHIYFEIVGDGIYADDLKETVHRYHDENILYKGWMEPDAIPKYLADINIGLLPVVDNTKFNRAKSPTKLFEYMAMAKPTISSYVGEAPVIIQDGENGFLSKTKDEFIDNMKRLIENPDLCHQVGEKAKKTVEEHYSLEILGRRLYGIISQI